MKRILIWGAGARADQFYLIKSLWKGDCIVGVIDKRLNGEWHSLAIRKPRDAKTIEHDVLVICSKFVDEIIQEYNEAAGEQAAQIYIFDELLESIRIRLIKKYSLFNDKKSEWINWFKNHELSVWGPYEADHTENEVYYEAGHPYIIVENEKLFYPDDYSFIVKEGRKWVYDVLSEQEYDSPHLYVREPEKLQNGVIVDAGACEGNFAIRYARNAKKYI